MAHAQADAERAREQAMRDSQQELRRLAEEATRRLALRQDPFDQFLDLAEGGKRNESR